MVELAVKERADSQEQERIERQEHVERERGNNSLKNDGTPIFDVGEYGVEQEQPLNGRAKVIDRIENCGKIVEEGEKDAVQVLDVAEEDIECREHHANANVHDHKANDGISEHKEGGGKTYAVADAEHKENDDGETIVDEGRDVLRKQEQVFGYVDLAQNVGVVHKARHTVVG